ncbi:hypothetical protein [Xylophilus sp.]|uniref:hypothetical protein n=1 Tax=Xylophilus sp. TaxID=2653893 RepID=UPI002D7F2E14|nr:hypothetical protein [Xylophilus sp.]
MFDATQGRCDYRFGSPYADATQQRLSPAIIRLFHPRSRLGTALAHGAEGCSRASLQKLLRPSEAKRASRIAEDFAFPNCMHVHRPGSVD